MSTAPLRWGVLGATSYVARRAVMPALRASPGAEIVVAASRSLPAAATYDDVLRDARVEAVYIPLPNALHREWTLRCAAAGKHVLCEKPLAVDAVEAAEMAAACEAAGVVLMEAYMTPFHPRSAAVVEIAATELGTLRAAHSAFTFPLRDAANHRWRPELGGGALLDVGIYCLSPLLALGGGDPIGIAASLRRADTGVDAATTGMLQFAGGLQASFECSFEAAEQQTLTVTGSRGTLRADRIFTGGVADVSLQLAWADGREETRRVAGVDSYRAMIEHFAGVVRGDVAPLRDAAESVRMARLLDTVRAAAAVAG